MKKHNETRSKGIICLLACAAALAAVLALAAWLVLSKEEGGTVPFAFSLEKGPAQPDFGQSAGAWAKNEAGYYFNADGEVIAAAVKKGIDVSKFQGNIDWQKAKDAGIDFAILRCGYGGEWNGEGDAAEYKQDDDTWRQNADACTSLGIPFGVYLYSYAENEADARSEADHVARLLGLLPPKNAALGDYTAAPYTLSMPVYYDLEDKMMTSLYPEETAALVKAFFEQLEADGYTGEQGLYASLNWVRGRLSSAELDPWREHLWIARYSSQLAYAGTYHMWQSTYLEPGEAYGVESETVDVDFLMEDLSITGTQNAESKAGGALPTWTNDTYKNEVWLAAPGDSLSLTLTEPEETDGGQKVYWATSDAEVVKVSRKGVLKAQGQGTATVTATLADGRQSVACTVRVGEVTVPVLATAKLAGDVTALADVAALKADTPDAILLDAGGSLQGTARASLSGGVDVTSALYDAGYDFQAFSAPDLAFGTERLRTAANYARGYALAANLQNTADGSLLFERCVCMNSSRISNGANTMVEEAGKKIGFFALCGTGNASAGAELTAAEFSATAAAQAQILKEQGADAVVCVLGPDVDAAAAAEAALQGAPEIVGFVAGGLAENTTAGAAVPVMAAGHGTGGVGRLNLNFAVDGSCRAAAEVLSAETLANTTWTATAETARTKMEQDLADLDADDAETLAKPLFTLEEPKRSQTEISFGNYVAQCYLNAAVADAANIPQEYAELGGAASLAGGITELEPGEITRETLLSAVPAGARVQLVQTTGQCYRELLEREDISETYDESRKQKDIPEDDTPVLVVTDTATLSTFGDQNYTVVRDYGDAFWLVRTAINDDTATFSQSLVLAE